MKNKDQYSYNKRIFILGFLVAIGILWPCPLQAQSCFITPNDYELPCNHPHFLDEFYSATKNLIPEETFPFAVADNGIGLIQNTFIPFSMDCYPLGEIIQEFELTLNIQHNDFSDLELILHAPSSMSLAPIQLAAQGAAMGTNVFTASTSAITDFNNLINTPSSSITGSVQSSISVIGGTLFPNDFGDGWYLQIKDYNDVINNSQQGGLVIDAVVLSVQSGFPFPYTINGCTPQSVSLLNEMVVETHCDQSQGNGAEIERVWEVTDNNNQTNTTTQTVELKYTPLNIVEFPADIDLECTGTPPSTFPISLTGKPQFDCFDIEDIHHDLCDFVYTYEDLPLPNCPNGLTIIRTWTILNWCTSLQNQHIQTIRYLDSTPPSFTPNSNIVILADLASCSANVGLSDLGMANDECSGVQSITASYFDSTLGTAVFTDLQTNAIENIPFGQHLINLTLQDSCSNNTSTTIAVTVIPEPTCCTPTLVLNNTSIANDIYQASQTISSSTTVNNGQTILFQAGQTICLDNGFEVELGADFEAKIEACGN